MLVDRLLLLLGCVTAARADEGRAHDVSGIVESLDIVAGHVKADVKFLDEAVAKSEELLVKANHPKYYSKDELEEAESQAENLVEVNIKQKNSLNISGDVHQGHGHEDHFCQVASLPGRIASIAGFSLGYQVWFAGFTVEEGVSYHDFQETLSKFFEQEVVVSVDGGVGSYYGLKEAAEYLIIALPAANMNLWRTASENAGLDAVPSMSFEGNVFKVSGHSETMFYNGKYPETMDFELTATFNPCSSLIAHLHVAYSPSFARNIAALIVSIDHSKYLGNYDTCMFHERYCPGRHKQYANFSECIKYLDSLPLVSKKCGDTRPFAGNSRSCKMKHKLMTAYDTTHCVHLGPLHTANGTPNTDHLDRWICSDEKDCVGSSDDIHKIAMEASQEMVAALGQYDRWVEATYKTDGTLQGYKFPVANTFNTQSALNSTLQAMTVNILVGLACFAGGALLTFAMCRRPAELQEGGGAYTELTSKQTAKTTAQVKSEP